MDSISGFIRGLPEICNSRDAPAFAKVDLCKTSAHAVDSLLNCILQSKREY